jgi:cytochrome c553
MKYFRMNKPRQETRGGAEIMKAVRLRVAVSAAAIALFVPAASYAGALQEKIEYCKTCHGPQGEGVHAFYLAPRLAGQQVDYLKNQFHGIAHGTRDTPPAKMFMVPVIKSVPSSMQAAIAKYFNGLDPRPAADGPRNLVAQGKKIFEEGVPDDNIPACAVCHGQDAKGQDQIPRLAGQFYSYTVAQLAGWKKGLRAKDPVNKGDDNTMVPIAASLNQKQIQAVAAFLSYQR